MFCDLVSCTCGITTSYVCARVCLHIVIIEKVVFLLFHVSCFYFPYNKKNPIHFNIPKTKPFTFSFILEAVNPDALGVFSVRKPLESLCRYFCITLLLPLLYLVCFYKEEIDSSLIPGGNGAFTIPTQLIQHQKNKKKFGLCNSNIQPTSELGETR